MAEIKAKFGDEVSTELIPAGRGMFEITLDGEQIYSKLQTRVFPRYGEITALITERM